MPRDAITVYQTPGRCITVICGNSGILYPFYKSSGKNSFSPGTWLPWMGYFLRNPQDPMQIYMAKPEVGQGVSPVVHKIMKQFLRDEVANDLIYRMGNDEAVVISCSLGGGVWKAVPELKQAIQELTRARKYLKDFRVHTITPKISIPQEQQRLVSFEGKQGTFEKISSCVAAVAEAMENITAKACSMLKRGKLVSLNVQDEQLFPSNERTMQAYEQISELGKALPEPEERSKYATKLRFLYSKQAAKLCQSDFNPKP